jgi:hypothetical protein
MRFRLTIALASIVPVLRRLAQRPKLTVEFTPPLVGVESTTWGRVKALYR